MTVPIEAMYYSEVRTWHSHLVQSHRKEIVSGQCKVMAIECLVPWVCTIQIIIQKLLFLFNETYKQSSLEREIVGL